MVLIEFPFHQDSLEVLNVLTISTSENHVKLVIPYRREKGEEEKRLNAFARSGNQEQCTSNTTNYTNCQPPIVSPSRGPK